MISMELMKLILQQMGMTSALTLQTLQMLVRLWQAMRDWYDDDLVLARAARSATTVEAGQQSARQREQAYLRFVYKEMRIEYPEGLKLSIPGSVEIVYPRLGVDALEVWERPARDFRYHRSESGGSIAEQEALQTVLERIRAMADTDLALARRQADQEVFQNTPEIIGYRRIIHPELSETGQSCGLCVVASTRMYKKEELLPIHDLCNCSVLPVTPTDDPGNDLNEEDLQTLYDAAGSNTAEDLLKTKVSFTEHGELGPIIRSGSGKSPRYERKEEESPIEAQIAKMRAAAERLASRQQRGENVAQEIGWLRDRVNMIQKQKNQIDQFRRTNR